jgi:splicing factor 3B subunit 2
MGALDVDYRTLYDAFFKHQNKASIQEKLTNFGDLYYEGKEFETQKSSDLKVGGPLSERLRDALGMTAENSPPPWLINMQRYGPPPSYPNLKIPGLNAPLPAGCSYGYHLNGWGKPPVDNFGRPLYGGNPFDPPGNAGSSLTLHWDFDAASGAIVTSDGKTIGKKPWGTLPTGIEVEEEEESSNEDEYESSDESTQGEMVESEEEEEGEISNGQERDDMQSKRGISLQDGVESVLPSSAMDLRKPDGEETPAPSKQLYTILHQTSANKEKQAGAVFTSDVAYVLPNNNTGTDSHNIIPEGAQSVLSKVPMDDKGKRKHREMEEEEEEDEEENEDLGKKFKF